MTVMDPRIKRRSYSLSPTARQNIDSIRVWTGTAKAQTVNLAIYNLVCDIKAIQQDTGCGVGQAMEVIGQKIAKIPFEDYASILSSADFIGQQTKLDAYIFCHLNDTSEGDSDE